MTTETVKLSDLWAEIKGYEGDLAPGSQTAMISDFWAALERAGVDVPSDHGLYETVQVPKDEADWWLAAYAALAANPGVESLQEIYDRI